MDHSNIARWPGSVSPREFLISSEHYKDSNGASDATDYL